MNSKTLRWVGSRESTGSWPGDEENGGSSLAHCLRATRRRPVWGPNIACPSIRSLNLSSGSPRQLSFESHQHYRERTTLLAVSTEWREPVSTGHTHSVP